ncbi:portal protein [Cupriavidus metallidurans]|uniref:portal protein n=1 Tax=Cupriavidus metallidurans TaxID=119219 RepID=UPI0016489E7B|nr:portal protein [Cupriavidus metallidurans]
MGEYTGDNQPNIKSPPREKLYTRWGQLKAERASWWSHWSEISSYLLPRSGRFFVQDRDRGQRRHNAIYDSTGTRALRVLAAGMMAGMTSPARPWFRLATSDPDLLKYGPVKVWLNDVTRLMQTVFERSNTYRALHSMYEELGAFGTAASLVMDDHSDVIRHYPLTTGEYCIATDYRGQVTTLYREFQKTVGEIVGEFGRDNCSVTVQNMYDRGTLDQWVTLIHAIEPRSDRDPSKRDNLNMAWKSVYFEIGGRDNQYLRESGFKEFKAVCPRWATAGGDIYGNSPGMEALGDVKQLQHEQLAKAKGINYKVNPPLQLPTALKNRDVETLPGGITYVDASNPHGGIRSAFEVNLDLSHLLEDIQDVRQRINSTFYTDMFLMLANDQRSGITATEVAERHEEKMLMLGPVLERLHNELLDPLVEMTFSRMVSAGIVPPPPEELQGQDLNVEFVSMLAQAQRAVGTNSVDRFVGNLGMVAQAKPDVLDKFDSDKWADVYADMLGVDPELIVPDDKVALIRQQRAQAQQAAQQAAMANSVADTAQKLGNVSTTGGNAASDIMQQFTGYTT